MKVSLKNIGALKQAEFTLGDLTIICGTNNTGKTYATYALFGFFDSWKEFLNIQVEDKKIKQLLTEGVTHIDLSEYIEKFDTILFDACQTYIENLPKIFAAPEDRFKESEFSIILEDLDINISDGFERNINASKTELLSIYKAETSNTLIASLLVEKNKISIPADTISQTIKTAIQDIIFSHIFPNPFIVSAERTGAAIFHKEFSFTYDLFLKTLFQRDSLTDFYKDYSLPIRRNIDFMQKLESFTKKKSFIAQHHSEVLTEFSDIIGGGYTVTHNDELYFIPKGKRIKLTMDESSSAVRSLLDIGFYLRHVAQKGDLLIVDEPELNLHPENQRRIARLFSRLVKLGIKVFITTHSDYIIKELNTLIMLNNDKPHLAKLAEQEGYKTEELLNAEQVKVYIAEEAPIVLNGKKRKTKCQTLTAADISQELGIEVRSFDKTIETMNRIQEEIIWGAD